MQHAISWFDLPATDLDRAMTFYQTILGITMQKTDMEEYESVFFPMNGETSVSGAITRGDWYQPSDSAGPLIYLNADPDVNNVLEKVEQAGGKVIVPKTSIGEHGYIGVLIDSEGNRVGLHSRG